MKRFNRYIQSENRWSGVAQVFTWLLPFLLCIPNIVLDFTEVNYLASERLVNIILPLGVYLIASSAFRRPGIAGLVSLPLMFLCAFQIVLLFLYGESIISIDMFLNVATTNSTEVEELLCNLSVAILVVCLIYLPAVVLAVFLTVKGITVPWRGRRYAFVVGIVSAATGIICIGAMPDGGNAYRIDRRLFPVNVISNMCSAVSRTALNDTYDEKSADFGFHSRDSRPGVRPEIYVMIIGETSRAGNWQLNGYGRPTNPRLSRRDGLVNFGKAMSESNTTHKSVPLLMSHLNAEAFGDSIYRCKSIIEAFSEAGYSTGWFSNQKRNHSLIDFFGEEADESVFITDDGCHHYDCDLCACLDRFLHRHNGEKCFVVLHSYGSHFNYKERTPQDCAYFLPDSPCTASKDNREHLVNAYDNSIRYVDLFIDSIIGIVDSCRAPAAVVYAADHGEDIHDDSRGRFLHASPVPTYWQLHVPMVVWTSSEYRNSYPGIVTVLKDNALKDVSTSHSIFHTLMSIAGIETPKYDSGADVCSPDYTVPSRIYLNDYNESVSFDDAGLRESDFAAISHAGMRL